ncbi:hypothetical protein ACFLSW_05190 [Candidatus Bipolaricaulota bacterium]
MPIERRRSFNVFEVGHDGSNAGFTSLPGSEGSGVAVNQAELAIDGGDKDRRN